MILSVNGTDGKWADVTGVKVRLEEGRYALHVDFVNPGLVLGRVCFEPVDSGEEAGKSHVCLEK